MRFQSVCAAFLLLASPCIAGVSQPPAHITTLSTSSFDFGQALPGAVVVQSVASLSNTAPQLQHLRIAISGSSDFTLVSGPGACSDFIPSGASCDIQVRYTPQANEAGVQTATVSIGANHFVTGPDQVIVSGQTAVLAP